MLPARDVAGAGQKAAAPALPLPTVPLAAASPALEMSQILPEL